MKKKSILLITAVALLFTAVSCDKSINNEPEIKEVNTEAVRISLDSNGKSSGENSVFLSLSEKNTTKSEREAWDIAIYCGNDHNRVKLNNTKKIMAIAVDKNKIEEVGLADTVNLRKDFSLNFHGGSSMLNFDSTDGDITKTIFAEVSENTTKNNVYFVVTEDTEKDKNEWYRVKVDIKGDTYIIKYAKIKDKEVKTIEIKKDAAYNFIFVSLDKGKTVNVEPAKDKWDIEYTRGINKTNMQGHGKPASGSATFNPYFMQDLIYINNLAKVEIAQIEISEALNYDNIMLKNISSLDFKKDKDAFADKWRSVFKGIFNQYFYVIKDAKGNYYKLKFLRAGLQDDGGVRGCPEIEFSQIK